MGCGVAMATGDTAKTGSSPTTAPTTAAKAQPYTLSAADPTATPRAIHSMLVTLYATYPSIESFVVEDVTYTSTSLGVVLGKCTAGGTGTTAQAQSSRLLACAPLIFFLFSFAEQHHVPAALEVADMIYSYAIMNIGGPDSSVAVLGGALRDWGVPVARTGLPRTSRAATALVADVRAAILVQRGVHLTISGYHGGASPIETITCDIGRASATEKIRNGGATATLVVTPKSAYFEGSRTGLTKLIGLQATAAKKLGSSWAQVEKGSAEYEDLAAEDTLAALPASVLPDSAQSVSLQSSTFKGEKVHVLTWNAAATQLGTQAALTETLTVRATGAPLPVSENSTVNSYRQVTEFTRWGERVAVAAPKGRVVQYNLLVRQ
jgi:hypothetical protein